MKALFISGSLFLIILTMSDGTFRYNKLSRALFAYGKSVAETSVINFDLSGNRIAPYFDKRKLEEKTKQYFADSLPKDSYSFSIIYLEANITSFPRSFQLSFSGDVTSFYIYEKQMKYVISKGLKNNE